MGPTNRLATFGISTLLVALTIGGHARAQITTDPAQISPSAQVIDFENFAVGAAANPLVIGNAIFSAGPGLGIVSLAGKKANGTEVDGNALIPFSSGTLPKNGYTPMTITFAQPVRQAGFGWYDPNGKNNLLTALDDTGATVAQGKPITGPTGGCCASFIGVVLPTDSIRTIIITPHKPSDFYAVDNFVFVRGDSIPPVFCSAKPSSAGCVSTLTTNNPLSQPVSGANDYTVFANQVEGLRAGTFLLSVTGPANLPFFGGTLCVAPPTLRVPTRWSAGTPLQCDGIFSVTVNDGMSPWDTGPGFSVWMQAWYRDPVAADGNFAASSDAVRFDFL